MIKAGHGCIGADNQLGTVGEGVIGAEEGIKAEIGVGVRADIGAKTDGHGLRRIQIVDGCGIHVGRVVDREQMYIFICTRVRVYEARLEGDTVQGPCSLARDEHESADSFAEAQNIVGIGVIGVAFDFTTGGCVLVGAYIRRQ